MGEQSAWVDGNIGNAVGEAHGSVGSLDALEAVCSTARPRDATISSLSLELLQTHGHPTAPTVSAAEQQHLPDSAASSLNCSPTIEAQRLELRHNSSLDALESSAELALRPAAVPLPPTHARSQSEASTSLSHDDPEHDLAASVPLPAEKSGSYRKFVKDLSPHLPHLNNVKASSRTPTARVQHFRFLEGKIKHIDQFECNRKRDLENLKAMLNDGDIKDCDLTFLIVEDLSSQMVEFLGHEFRLSPEMFEEHLNNSGWQDGQDKGGDPRDWTTSNLQKDYISVNWLRPTRINMPVPSTQQGRELMLDSDKQLCKWVELVEMISPSQAETIKAVQYKARPTSNISRSHWSLETTNHQRYVRAAWEERATICTRQIQGRRTIIVLLDPLPLVELTVRGERDAIDKLKKRAAKASVPFRGDGLPADATGATRKDPTHQDLLSVIKAFAFGANRHNTDPEGDPKATTRADEESIAGMDATTTMTQSRQRQAAWKRSHVPGRSDMLDRVMFPWSDGVEGRDSLNVVVDEHSYNEVIASFPFQEGAAEDDSSRTVTEQTITCLFHNLRSRVPMDYARIFTPQKGSHRKSQHSRREKLLIKSTSTAADIRRWIQPQDIPLATTSSSLWGILCSIVCNDTVELCMLLHRLLDDMDHEMLVDYSVQSNLSRWKEWFEQFDVRVSAVERSLDGLCSYSAKMVTGDAPDRQSNHVSHNYIELPEVQSLIQDARVEIEKAKVRKTNAYAALISNINIVDSKKGITQSESVVKITELGFLFIPISFGASIFGMQVKELDPATTSISAFFTVCIVSLILLYSFRLFIRSNSFQILSRKISNDIRAYEDLGKDTSISAFSVIRWLLSPQRVRKALQEWSKLVPWLRRSILIQISSAIVVGIALYVPLWTSSIEFAVKVPITVVISLFFIVWIVIMVARAIQKDHIKQLTRYQDRDA